MGSGRYDVELSNRFRSSNSRRKSAKSPVNLRDVSSDDEGEVVGLQIFDAVNM